MVGYIFGGNTGETPESIARKRAIAAALIKGNTRQPQNVGEAVGQGLNGLGNALVYRALMGEADKGEDTVRAQARAEEAALFGGSTTPPSDSLGGPKPTASIPSPEAASEVAATSPSTGNTYEPFMTTIKEGGVQNPYALAAIAATGRAESGWSAENANRTWDDPSESGQPGKAGGIMSWRGPRYQALAATGDLSPQGQAKFFLQESPELIQKLNSAKSVEEAQQFMNDAWKFAGYDRPGGESSRRLSFAKGYLPSFQGGNTEVASLDPSAGMSAANAIDAAAKPSGYIDPQVSVQADKPAPQPEFDMGRFGPNINLAEMPPTRADIAPQIQTQTASLGAPVTPAAALAAEPPPAPQENVAGALRGVGVPDNATAKAPTQLAQALLGKDYYPAAPSAPGQSGPSTQQLLAVMNNPYSSEGSKVYAQSLLEQRQKQSDPNFELDRRYKQAQIDALDRKADKEGGDEWGLAPVWGKDKDGKTVLGQVSKSGKFKPLDTGDFQPTPGLDKVDTGTQFITRDSKTGEVISATPKENYKEAAEKASGAADAKANSEVKYEYDSIVSKMPGLYSVVGRLEDLADEATYTLAGQGVDWARNQMGMAPRDAAVARAEYTATVDNQILPLLRDTFGAQFTDAEGIRLARTLGDADKSPTEKQALLRAFIKQKERDIEALKNRVGGTNSTPLAPPAAPQAPQAPKSIRSQSEYESLPSGAEFIAPDGSKRRKP